MGNVSIENINLSLNNIWRSWFKFRRGKRKNAELEDFQFHLEDNLWRLFLDLNEEKYVHGRYNHFTVNDSKRRDISVASVRDRVVHRLIYEYLVEIYDHTFIHDAWSCRKGKGLLGAIERTQKFLGKYPHSFVWRADVKKFFDNVNQDILLKIISRKIKDEKALRLIEKSVRSYSSGTDYVGIPIGNITSQIFANIYQNELDRFVKYYLKPQFYLRYGDDFIIIAKTRIELEKIRRQTIDFLKNSLKLEINWKNDIIIPVKSGVRFLGAEIYANGRCLKTKNWQRVKNRLSRSNVSSYSGLIKQHFNKKLSFLNWLTSNLYE